MGSLRCYHKSQIWEPTTVPFFSSPLVNIRSCYTLVPDDKVNAAMKKAFWEIYSRNLSSKISLPISYPAPILHKKKIISVRSLLLSGSVHFLMTWGLGLGSNRRCYYQRFLSSTLVSKSSKTFLEKPSVDSANTPSKHMCTSCTAHPPEASFCEPKTFLCLSCFSVGMHRHLCSSPCEYLYLLRAPIGIFSLHLPLIGNAPPHQCWYKSSHCSYSTYNSSWSKLQM